MAYLGDGLNKLSLKLHDRGMAPTHACIELGKLVLIFTRGRECHLLALFQSNLSEEERVAFIEAAREAVPALAS